MTQKIPFALLVILLLPCWGIAWKPGADLGVYYLASTWLQKGWVTQLYLDNAEIGNFFYGPFGLALLKPLALISFNGANVLWLILQTLSFVGFWFFIFKIFPELKSPHKIWMFVLVWLVSIKPIHACFQSHNVQLMFAAILAGAEIGSHSRNKLFQLLSGILVALLASIKIYPAFIGIYYLLKRSLNVKLGLGAGALISLVFPLFVFGWKTGLELPKLFISNALHYHHVYDLAKDTVSLSFPSLLAVWLPGSWKAQGAVSMVTLLVTFLYFYWVFLTRHITQREEKYFWAFSWSIMALLNSTTRPDYFIYFVPAFASLPLLIKNNNSKLFYRLGIFISVALIAFITEWILGSRDLTHYLESLRVPVLGILILCFMQFKALRTKLIS